jgi:hypothetical protein
MAMVGAAAGAALKPNDPLKGAMLGATAGFTGGTALGVGAAGGAAAGTAGTAAATGAAKAAATPYVIPGLTGGAAPALAGQTAAAATPYAIPGLTGGVSSAFAGQTVAAPYSIPGLTGGVSPAFAGTNSLSNAMSSGASGFPVNPSIGQAASPSFVDKLSMAGKSAYAHPGESLAALNATQGLLTPEQMPQMSAAPAVPIQTGRQLKPSETLAYLDPYRQSAISNQPISLLG